MVTNQQTKTTPPRLIRLLVASSLILVLVSLRVNADEQSAREALDHESTYQPIDYVATNALLPKWGGSREEVQQFVTLAVAKSSAAEGSQAYARIMFNIARADPEPVRALTQVGVQWPLLKTSLEEISVAYPDPWNLNTERAMACLMGTRADYDAVAPRVSPHLIFVAWFDKVSSWPECQRQQERARQSTPASWAQALVSTPPSVNFVAAAAGGVLLPLALLYLARHRRIDEPSPLDEVGGSPASGGEYPRIYRVTPAWKTGICLLAGILLLGSLAGAWGFGVIAAETRDAPRGLVLAFFFAAVASAMAFYIIDTLKSAIVLKSDRLEVHELWRVRRVLRSNIETQQVLHPPNSPAVLMLRLKAPSNRKIKLPITWHTDSTWQAWLAAIPDVDAEAAKAFEAAIDANTELGTTPAERQQKLSTARSVTRLATGANIGLFAWAYIYPHPYELVIFVLAALPWVAVYIMARSPGLYVLNAPRGSGRPDLTILLISPGFLLTIRALQDFHILDWQRLLLLAALVAMALMGGILWALPSARQRLGAVALTLALLMSYGYGAAALGNAVLDRTKGSTYPTTVYGKHVTSGRNRTPMMQLGPWGPRAMQEETSVPWEVYRSTAVGDKVCVLLHPGAFSVPRAPMAASRCAATSPMPEVAPVMTTTLPCIEAVAFNESCKWFPSRIRGKYICHDLIPGRHDEQAVARSESGVAVAWLKCPARIDRPQRLASGCVQRINIPAG
jgi:hypothetical protein